MLVGSEVHILTRLSSFQRQDRLVTMDCGIETANVE